MENTTVQVRGSISIKLFCVSKHTKYQQKLKIREACNNQFLGYTNYKWQSENIYETRLMNLSWSMKTLLQHMCYDFAVLLIEKMGIFQQAKETITNIYLILPLKNIMAYVTTHNA